MLRDVEVFNKKLLSKDNIKVSLENLGDNI